MFGASCGTGSVVNIERNLDKFSKKGNGKFNSVHLAQRTFPTDRQRDLVTNHVILNFLFANKTTLKQKLDGANPSHYRSSCWAHA